MNEMMNGKQRKKHLQARYTHPLGPPPASPQSSSFDPPASLVYCAFFRLRFDDLAFLAAFSDLALFELRTGRTALHHRLHHPSFPSLCNLRNDLDLHLTNPFRRGFPTAPHLILLHPLSFHPGPKIPQESRETD